MDIGQAEVPAAVAVGELLVVETHELKDRRVQIVDVNLLSTALQFARSSIINFPTLADSGQRTAP